MADILVDDNFKYIFLNENYRIPIQLSLKFVPRSPIDNKPAMVQVMAWRQTGDKPLPELLLTQFTDAYMQHYGEIEHIVVTDFLNILEWSFHRWMPRDLTEGKSTLVHIMTCCCQAIGHYRN